MLEPYGNKDSVSTKLKKKSQLEHLAIVINEHHHTKTAEDEEVYIF